MKMPEDKAGRPGWLRRLISWSPASSRSSFEQRSPPESQYRAVYARFREILASNDSALELFADIEDTLAGRTPLVLDVMIQRIRQAGRDVHAMADNLVEIAGGRHGRLHHALRRITGQIEAELPARKRTLGPVVVPIRRLRATHDGLAGAKMANLGEVWWGEVGVDVPDGFVITSAAFSRFMTHNELWERVDALEEIYRNDGLQALTDACAELQAAIEAAELPPDVARKTMFAFDALAGDDEILVSVRSSALGEDRSASHAGLYRTELQVPRERLFDAYRRVVASAYSSQAVVYRVENDLAAWEATMAVGVLRMVEARCAGVMFSRDFSDLGADRVIVSAVRGLAADLVGGAADAEELVIENGVAELPAGSCLDAAGARLLARTARILEKHFRRPQDIEWVIDSAGALFILQTRPLIGAAPPEGLPPEVAAAATLLLAGGRVACPGVAAGVVQCVHEEKELDHVAHGCVLVARHSFPAIARVMSRCAAIVTEVGSPIGHMAILAREFQVPCIVGLTGALAALADKRQITVDAAACRVYDGALKLPSPSLRPAPLRPAVDTEPLQILRRVARHVTPLHLTDPAGQNFAPEHCETLHDVTRYVHEKVFGVMFHFGDMAEGDSSSAFSLEASLPFRLLIFDVGGGLPERDESSRAYRPDEVTSVPLRAFLDGLLDPRIRWDQPRPLSTRGFLSVLGESMAGPPAAAQQIGRTSYAVISDRYMNFSTKAGYHFSTVDTYCGPTQNRNYIHFRFTGGGASPDRRERRVRFLRRVLGQLGFQTADRGDGLVARLEKHEAQDIEARLKQLGQLTMVTRQLDMLMDSDQSPDFFAQAFLEDRLETF